MKITTAILHKEKFVMSQTTKLENVIETVHTMSANYFDETFPVRDMKFDSATSMWIDGDQVEVLPSAIKLFSNRLRVPYSYLSRCPENLQALNLNYWLEQEQAKRETLFCRFDGDRLRAVFTDRYQAMDNLLVLSKMLEYGFQPQQEVQYSLDDEMLVVKVPEYERAFKVLDKDNIVPGISIENSEVGVLALCISAYYLRLICTNGLIGKTSVDARYKHISQRCMEKFPLILVDVISQSHNGQNRFLISTQTPVSNPIATIETFSRQFQLPQNEVEFVKQAFFAEQGDTMFAVINAFTRAAQTPQMPISVSHQMERIGGSILAMVKH
jgi:hypothetical protein